MCRVHASIAAAGFIFLMSSPTRGFGQQQLPAVCSAADRQSSAQYTQVAIQALVEGRLARFAELSQAVEDALSPACRAALARSHPVAVKCSRAEKSAVLSSYFKIMAAALSGDLQQVFRLSDDLEASLSRSCWIAINRIQDPVVVQACTDQELDFLASQATPLMRATEQSLGTGDLTPVYQMAQRMMEPLGPACRDGLTDLQRRMQVLGGQQSWSTRLPNVLDHGGGTFSVPGLGACTPSGCMAY